MALLVVSVFPKKKIRDLQQRPTQMMLPYKDLCSVYTWLDQPFELSTVQHRDHR